MTGRSASAHASHLRLDRATRRALLVEAAAEVFHGRDPSDVRFDEVAEAAGVSRSLVYAYFGDRGTLIAAVYLHNLTRLDGELGRALESPLPDQVRLRRLIRRYLVFARDNQTSWNLLAAAGALQHPAIQTARRERIERIAGAWTTEPAARLIACGVLGFLEGGAQDWIDYRDRGIDRTTDILFNVLWEGLGGRQNEAVRAAG